MEFGNNNSILIALMLCLAITCFSYPSVIRGYNEYKDIWFSSYNGRGASLHMREVEYHHDPLPYTVAEEKAGGVIDGHLSKKLKISSICNSKVGSIYCIVTGSRHYASGPPQGALEVYTMFVAF